MAVRGGWRALYHANRVLIGANPDVILPGMHLHLPGHHAAHPLSGPTLANFIRL